MAQLLTTLALGALWCSTANASLFRSYEQEKFKWETDPEVTKPCEEPGCYNHAKSGFKLVETPIQINRRDVEYQFADKERTMLSEHSGDGSIRLWINTQPGCEVSGIAKYKVFNFIPRTRMVNFRVYEKPNQPDGSVEIDYGGMFHPSLPEGDLFVRFTKRNALTREDTCTYTISKGRLVGY